MELIRKPIHYTQEGKSIFDQFNIDEEYIVPDQKDDVGHVIYGTGELKPDEIRPIENYLKVTGKFCFHILYMSSSGDPRPAVIEGTLPVEEMIYTETDGNETFFMKNMRTEFSVSVVNSRKLSIHAMAEIEIGRESLRDGEFVENIESEVPVYTKTSKMKLLGLAVSRKDTYRIKEEISIPGTKESIGQILLKDISSRKMDIRTGDGEILIRGELLVFCLYLSPDEKADWIEQTVPYEGRISCENASDGMYFHIRHSLEDTLLDVRLDEDGEARRLGIEATMALGMNLYEEEETEMLTDMYSLEKKCSFETKESVLEELLMQNQSRCKISERIALPELKEDVLQIIHSQGSIQMESEQHTPEGIKVEGILHILFLYLRGDDTEPFGSWQGIMPFSYLIEYPDLPENVSTSLSYYAEQLSITLAGSEAVEVRAVLAFDIFMRKMLPVSVITDVTFEDPDMEILAQQPGIVGHIVQKGEDLWQLAKKYMTTMDSIIEDNHLQSPEIHEGDKLLIFKENMSIL